MLAVLSDSYVPQSTHLLLYSETSRKRSRTILVCLRANQRERQVRSYAKNATNNQHVGQRSCPRFML